MAILDDYYKSYENLFIHQLMLQDKERIDSYIRSFENNKEFFVDKLVLDVGCGTGILSLLAAKYGARKVFAVEGSNISFLAERIIEDNLLSDRIDVIHGVVEEIDLPVEKVDIIISEWMGFYLLHEGMLDSIIFARNKWLDSNGLIFPCKASLYVTLVELEEFWKKNIQDIGNIQGFDYSSMKNLIIAEYMKTPLTMNVEPKNVRTFSIEKVLTIDLTKIQSANELDFIESNFDLKSLVDTEHVHGFIIWFDTEFPSIDGKTEILSTSPFNNPTHWKQTIILFQQEMQAKRGLNLKCHLELDRSKNLSKRNYSISIDIYDAKIL